MKNSIYTIILLLIVGCTSSISQDKRSETPVDFNAYWYGGKAEITSYELEQSRYGEVHMGTSVLVFVTEPFSASKQVKLDNWRDSSEDNVSVMKLNKTKKFLTGIYPYSMMMSTFKPVSYDKYPKALKVTTSSQEWCGHTFMQMNLKNNDYQLKGYSYFESEGDVDMKVKEVLLEDELWTTIRLNPASLPTGSIELFPSTFYFRLKHQEAVSQKADVNLSSLSSSEFSEISHQKYSIKYPGRELIIYFEQAFPYTILGWEETYSGLTTKAKRINTIKSAYWGKNSNADREIRKKLGLSME